MSVTNTLKQQEHVIICDQESLTASKQNIVESTLCMRMLSGAEHILGSEQTSTSRKWIIVVN